MMSMLQSEDIMLNKNKLIVVLGGFLLTFFLGGIFDHFFFNYQDEKVKVEFGSNKSFTVIDTPALAGLNQDYLRIRNARKVARINERNFEQAMIYYKQGIIDNSLEPKIGYFVDYSQSYDGGGKWFVVKQTQDGDSRFQPIKR